MSKRTKSRCRGKAGAVELLTKQIKWSFKGKPKPAILWMLMCPQNKPAKGLGESAQILELGVEEITIRE